MSNEIFKSEAINIYSLFTNNDPIYKIPEYQRPYSWLDEQVEELWDDLYTAYQNDEGYYFLGSIILSKNERGLLDVIDGQQRLTTLMILLNIIYKKYPNLNEGAEIDLFPNVINSKKIGYCIKNFNDVPRLRLHTHSIDKSDFEQSIINGKIEDFENKPDKKNLHSVDKKFLNTAHIFSTKISELNIENVNKFSDFLMNKTNLIKIECGSVSSAIKLFQVLNNRGLDLSAGDILKSVLMEKLDEINYDSFVSDWNVISKGLEKTDGMNITDLFQVYLFYLTEANPKKNLVDELSPIIKKGDSMKIIYQLKEFHQIYLDYLWEDDRDKTIHSLWSLPWTIWKTLIITALYKDYKEKDKLFKLLQRFFYLNWISGKTYSAIKQTSFNLISLIKNNSEIKEIEEIIEVQLTKFGVKKLALENLEGDVDGFPWIKPILALLEYKRRDKDFSNYIYCWDRNLHLEHILPHAYGKNPSWSHVKEGENYLHIIGNLALLYRSKNIEAQNYSFEEKKLIYQGKGKNNDKDEGVNSFKTTEELCQLEFWNEESIEKRKNDMIGQIRVILDF